MDLPYNIKVVTEVVLIYIKVTSINWHLFRFNII